MDLSTDELETTKDDGRAIRDVIFPNFRQTPPRLRYWIWLCPKQSPEWAAQDLYGVGIRAGTYCQRIATLVAGMALPEEAASIQTTTIYFQCAVLGTLILVTLRRNIAQPEVLVIVPLVFGGFVAAQTFEPGTMRLIGGGGTGGARQKMPFGLRALVMLQILGALAGYSLWFWCKGLDSTLPAEADPDAAPCTYYAFMLSRVEVSRPRVFEVLMSGLGGICFVVADALSLVGPALSYITSGRRIAVWHLIAAALGIGDAQDTMDTPRWRIWAKMIVSFTAIGYIVVMVEITLAWNPIEGANGMDSVGQLVPLIIGAMGLVKIAYLFLRERLQVHSGSPLASPNGSGELELSEGIGN
ncbi:hypothetical protein B0T24DRAFT_596566 [Lasiosphaeria ovina]|uniref:Uncharacterized protein n=1 Tax=Lasiosphaeria ovina TaxID=92902 RepID=A0AAE0JZ10_9PEZI|nr:hypothetical protein B0T24DRAFT_596566 [Lasiosphaeria ovina]